jgi:thioredoxin-related protein
MKAAVLFWIVAFGTMLHAGEIVWQKDLQQAFAKAEREQRPLMVMVEGKYCRWCRKMRYRTLDDKKVIEKLASYVNVRVDKEDGEAMHLLPSVQGVPTVFLFSYDRKVSETAIGYYDADDFLDFFVSFETKKRRRTGTE